MIILIILSFRVIQQYINFHDYPDNSQTGALVLGSTGPADNHNSNISTGGPGSTVVCQAAHLESDR